MIIKRDPVTKLWCREDGMVCLPPSKGRFKVFRWTFGSSDSYGYRQIGFHGKIYKAHQIVCRAFNGLAPTDKPFVDHINRIKSDNRSANLRWVDYKENNDNKDKVDRSIAKFKVRCCDDRVAYDKAWYAAHPEKGRAYAKAYRKRRRLLSQT